MPQLDLTRRPAKKTKIVATIGPASESEDILRKMIMAGLDVVRINFSHGTPEMVTPIVERVRKISDEMQVPIAILGDLRGPRLRVGEIEGGSVELETGNELCLTPEKMKGTAERVNVTFAELGRNVKPGDIILLDDGNIELSVKRVDSDDEVVCRIIRGGKLSSNRGINLPGIRVNLPSLSAKDFADVDYAIEQGFDYLALSFVQSADDVRLLNAYLAPKQAKIPVISKIEKKGALDDIEAIVEESFGVMVARGDLALEMSTQDVPIAQKRIIAVCRKNASPVITATQMLESMIHLHKPTRAEATDIANAILDGTDAVMLSAETAIGDFPVEAVATMSAIAIRTESAWIDGDLPAPAAIEPGHEVASNVAFVSQVLAKSLSAKAITTYTTSGATALRVSCHRYPIPILAFTSEERTKRRLALIWGVTSVAAARFDSGNEMIDYAMDKAVQLGMVEPGDIMVITGSARPYGLRGQTNSLRVEYIPDKSY